VRICSLELRLKVAQLYGGRKASCSLRIVIVGCGLAGIAAAHTLTQAGHRVTILEQASCIGEVGAGMQVSPNVSRLLIRWGLGEYLAKLAVVPQAVTFRRCT
jgi:salicylate hydroxylase